AEQEGQQTETEATGAPQKHHYTLNQQVGSITHAGLNKPPILARLTRSLQRRNAKIENRLDDFHRFPNNECVLTHNQVIS
ncbi:hypothetical protein, partial [Klebsiella pneumoniae]|uniref:hypothetical protein n=1 Tax=Klebsiella pneumoniae TaxID=573 RepID=UPI001C6E0194